MNEKRFWKMKTFQGFCDIFDNEKTICSVRIEYADTLLNLLNSLSEENEQLRQQLKEKEEDEQLYANEIVKLNKEAKEVLDFKSLGGNY